MTVPEPTRVERHRAVCRTLASLGDDALQALVAGGMPLGSGIGGSTVRLDVEDVPVFVKRVPLTDLEREPGNEGSTANLFGLPMCCHYGIGSPGIGSPGFGAWREAAAHDLTTGWVLGGAAACFPLTYHWRVVPTEPAELPAELRDVEAAVRYWDDSTAVRLRLDSLAAASACVLLFCEYVPHTLRDWLTGQLAHGTIGPAAEFAERELLAAADRMAVLDFLHLDAHFENILTDGDRIYLADFGLAVSAGFDLADDERAFFQSHRGYDRSYMVAQLGGWLRRALEAPASIPQAAQILDRYEPVVATVRPFYRALRTESRTVPYPEAAERAAWAGVTQQPAADPALRE